METAVKTSVRKKQVVLRQHSKVRSSNELVEAARAASGIWSKRVVTNTQVKKLRKRLGYDE